MNESIIFIAMATVAVVLGVIVVVVIKSLSRGSSAPKQTTQQKEDEPKITLEDLLIIVSDKDSTQEEIAKASLYFIQKFPIPAKNRGRVPSDAIPYLKFVSLVSGHKKSDAKLISYLTNELDKQHAEYIAEIEEYKNMGLRARF